MRVCVSAFSACVVCGLSVCAYLLRIEQCIMRIVKSTLCLQVEQKRKEKRRTRRIEKRERTVLYDSVATKEMSKLC